MRFSRFMTAHEFIRELDALKAFTGEFVGANLLDSLHALGLLIPLIRIRYPDPIARRFWLLTHEHMPRQLKLPVEPDGPRWDAALAFDQALHRWQNSIVYGLSINPLDDPEERFLEFIERPSEMGFVPRVDMRVDVSNDVEETLFDDSNFEQHVATFVSRRASRRRCSAENELGRRRRFGSRAQGASG